VNKEKPAPDLILCIDDEAMLLKSTVDFLEDSGYRVVTAPNGRKGLDVFREVIPDAVFLDLCMPVLDGFDVLKVITSESPEIPVIVMSGVFSVQDVISAQRMGAWDYIAKPVLEMELVLQSLERALQRSRLMRENREYAEYLKELVEERTKELKDANRVLEEEIAERKRNEEGLRYAMDHVKLANRVKGDFLARMSHEIRTPLNAIIGMVNLAFMTDDDFEKLDYLITVRESADHLMAIINDILDFSKIEAGKLHLEIIPFNLRRFMNDIIRTMSIRAGEKSLYLQLIMEDDLPLFIRSDPTRLRQVMINLISNALKFTSRGGVVVKVEAEDNQRDDGQKAIELKITVNDTGIGIPEDRLDNIFDSFTQSDDSISRKYGGTGLGLAICWQLVSRMQGNIEAESEEGKGSTFSFHVPVGVVPFDEVPAQEDEKKRLPSGETFAILMAEDNEINQKLNVTVLQKLGHSVTVAKNGLVVLEEMRNHDFDLILMDIEMPYMDGIEATRRIRDGEVGEEKKNIPVIAITAHVQDEIKKQCFDAGMNDYVGKPIKIEVLGNRIEALMQKERPSLDDMMPRGNISAELPPEV